MTASDPMAVAQLNNRSREGQPLLLFVLENPTSILSWLTVYKKLSLFPVAAWIDNKLTVIDEIYLDSFSIIWSIPNQC